MTNREALKASARLQKILRDNMFDRKQLSTSGLVSSNRLAFHKTSRKLFERSQYATKRSYNVELLIDDSGSMYYGDAEAAHRAAYNICGTLGPVVQSLNVVLFNALEISTHWKSFGPETHLGKDKAIRFIQKDGLYHPVWMHGMTEDDVWRQFSRDKYKPYLDKYGNWDVCNVMNAADRLRAKDGKKIIFVILDGQPNMDNLMPPKDDIAIAGRRWTNYPVSQYAQRVKQIESAGIHVVAIGIGTSAPSKYFTNFTTISDASEVYDVVVKQFHKLVNQ